jgi:2,4-dienoyl-CoA reductase-like NADH-dependent reductase (Old Yellow Enzyme family)
MYSVQGIFDSGHRAPPSTQASRLPRSQVLIRLRRADAHQTNMTTLFDPLSLGDVKLPNRIIMAPLTRSRAGASRIANHLMAEYYAQRASAGLILSEATVVSPMGIGYAGTPGIWSTEQVEGWKLTTRAVHEAGGRIFLQLWHVGRVSDPSFLNGGLPVAPSAVAAKGNVSLLRPPTPFVTPRALDAAEIPGIIEAFRHGAQNAQLAGFDGVELHGANGYLLDQFLQDSTNLRTDDYGGSLENRARLMLEVTDAVISVWGAGRVGVHLAPRGDAHSMGDSALPRTFEYVARRLGERGIAFICAREYIGPDRLGPRLKAAFGGVYIANEKFNYETAEQAVASGEADAVAFGKLFIANPDLPQRFALQSPLNEPRPAEFYTGGAEGYTDYPALSGKAQSPDLNNVQARVNARASSGV